MLSLSSVKIRLIKTRTKSTENYYEYIKYITKNTKQLVAETVQMYNVQMYGGPYCTP